MQMPQWECNICGKTEQPQDYVNMERHIWWRNEKTKKPNKKENQLTRPSLAYIQKLRLDTLCLNSNLDDLETQEQQIQQEEETPKKAQTNTEHQQEKRPTAIWGKLEYITWQPEQSLWKCNLQQCNKVSTR